MEVEERVGRLEKMTERLSKRPIPQRKLFVTPYPIFGYIKTPDDGVVFRGLFHVDGSITGGTVAIDKMPEGGVVLSAIIKDKEGEKAISYGVKKDIVSIDTAVEVEAGSKVTIKVTPVNPEKEIVGVWTSLLWTPGMKSLKKIKESQDAV